ncbi:uncharacterized protein LOC108263031, partial [Tachysurus ichikawai]
MLRDAIIKESTSPLSNPIVVVPKPDESLNSYPLPQVDDLMACQGRAHFISALDLTKGYWQVALSVTFQCLMDKFLRPLHQFAAFHMNDVIIHSSTWSDHLYHLGEVLEALQNVSFTANRHKCHLRLTEYLGYCIEEKEKKRRKMLRQSWSTPNPP